MKKIFLFSGVLILMLTLSSSLYAQPSRSTVLIEYNCETQNFDTPPPLCIPERSQVVVRYTHINPFLHNSHLVVEQIDHKYEDGIDAFNKAKETAGNEAAKDTTTEKVTAEASKKGYANLMTEMMTYADATFAEPEKSKTDYKKIHLLLENKIKLLDEVQIQLTALESIIYSVNQIMQLDTIIKIARKNEYNRSDKLMRLDINNRTTFNINTGNEIENYFINNIHEINGAIAALQALITKLEAVNTELTEQDKKLDFSSAISDIQTNVNKISASYSGENLRKLINNTTAIKNNYQNTVSAEYMLRGDSVVCARGDYLQLKDAGMGIDFRPIKTKGGSRIDFSVGIALSMGDVTGWNYTLNKVNDSTIYLITDKENKTVLPNPVVMMHWYVTRCSNIAWMLSFGVSPDIGTLADTKLFLGGSIGGFSSNNIMRRFILSAGVSCGAADVLKAKYKNKDREKDNNFHSFGNISDSDLTEKAYRFGGFVSLTWNLGGKDH